MKRLGNNSDITGTNSDMTRKRLTEGRAAEQSNSRMHTPYVRMCVCVCVCLCLCVSACVCAFRAHARARAESALTLSSRAACSVRIPPPSPRRPFSLTSYEHSPFSSTPPANPHRETRVGSFPTGNSL